MLAARTAVKLLTMIVVLLSIAACDDDKKEKPEYEVEIYFSEDVKIEWQTMKAERGFKKPTVQVHHPEGVEVTHVEREPRKKTVIDFEQLSWLALLASLFAISLFRLPTARRRYAFDGLPSKPSPPVYQRA